MAKRFAILLFIAFLLGGNSIAAVTNFSVLDNMVVQDGGRKKPYLVFAEESLQGLSGKTSLTVEDAPWSASALITTLWLQPEGWSAKPLILLNNLQLKKELGLPLTQKWFSYDQLSSNVRLRELLSEATTQRSKGTKPSGMPKEAATIGTRLADFETLTKGSRYRVIPNSEKSNGPWQTVPEFSNAQLKADFSALQTAFVSGNQEEFDKQAGILKAALHQIHPEFFPSARILSTELAYQRIHPFRWAWICYAAAAIILGLTSVRVRRTGYALGWVLALAGFGFQIYGFASRIIVAGRPPVTNMYESVVWVSFGAILFALIFEAIYRSRYFLLGAAPVVVVALILADTQPVILNPAINPLTPVLRDNFWLTTHVLTITLSYAAFLLAMGVGHIALGMVAFRKQPPASLYNYIYRTLQVGVLLLATGTILGGVWANYSWGRFWDWDPKETWALITLLTYLLVLHGRIAGSWGGFGLALGSVICFLSVMMAWYGVNFVLGVGLHSYGFGSGGFSTVGTFVGLDLAFVAFSIFRYRQMKGSRKSCASTDKPAMA